MDGPGRVRGPNDCQYDGAPLQGHDSGLEGGQLAVCVRPTDPRDDWQVRLRRSAGERDVHSASQV